LLAKAIFAAWATAATGLSVAALVSAVIRAEGSAQPVVSGVGVSIGSLLAALFLWRAYSRVGSRSR
jgi:membrane protein implicated in regulation of membrane protease activity